MKQGVVGTRTHMAWYFRGTEEGGRTFYRFSCRSFCSFYCAGGGPCYLGLLCRFFLHLSLSLSLPFPHLWRGVEWSMGFIWLLHRGYRIVLWVVLSLSCVWFCFHISGYPPLPPVAWSFSGLEGFSGVGRATEAVEHGRFLALLGLCPRVEGRGGYGWAGIVDGVVVMMAEGEAIRERKRR